MTEMEFYRCIVDGCTYSTVIFTGTKNNVCGHPKTPVPKNILSNTMRNVYHDIPKITLSENGKLFNGMTPERFSYSDFEYFDCLAELVFEKCNFASLDFIVNHDKLEKIILSDCAGLVTVKNLENFKCLNSLEIRGICKVKDLHILEKCDSLKSLSVPKGTNTGVFTKNINFEIKIIE